jgi:peroxiredoxin
VKALRFGDAAPSFETVALDGTTLRVPTAGSWILISFLRYASCPMCNLRVRELVLRTAELESHRITWVAVFHSPPKRLTRHLHGDALRHVVADPRRALYERYGVGRSWWGILVSLLVPSFYLRFLRAGALGYWGGAIDDSFHSMPADFLVSPDGLIRLAHYGRHIGDHAHVPSIVNGAQTPTSGSHDV